MKRIIFVLDELFPVRGAPQIRIRNLLASLPTWERYAIGGKLTETDAPDGFTLLSRPSERQPIKFLFFLVRLGQRARALALKLKPDAIVLSVPKYEMLVFAPVLGRLTPMLILDFRDSLAFLDYAAYLRHFLPKPLATLLGATILRANRFLQKRAISSATVITVANEGIKRSVSHPKVVVVPNGVDTEIFQPRSKVWFDGTRPLKLVYLGNFAEKDLFDWLTALKGTTNLEIHLIGDGRNRAKVAQELEGLCVKFYGSIPHDELPKLLEQMDLGFIFRKPGIDQSIPVCLFEFTSSNIPSLCNATGIMAKFVNDNRIGDVFSNKNEFKAKIDQILADPAELRKFERLHDFAVQELSLSSSRLKFAKIFAD